MYSAIDAWARSRPGRGLAVVMTGTDLYRDLAVDDWVRRSLSVAQKIVVLQPEGLAALPADLRWKAQAIFQSTSERRTLAKPVRRLWAVMVGHLRDEKDPRTLFAAARLLRDRADIAIDHIGHPLVEALGREGDRRPSRVRQLGRPVERLATPGECVAAHRHEHGWSCRPAAHADRHVAMRGASTSARPGDDTSLSEYDAWRTGRAIGTTRARSIS